MAAEIGPVARERRQRHDVTAKLLHNGTRAPAQSSNIHIATQTFIYGNLEAVQTTTFDRFHLGDTHENQSDVSSTHSAILSWASPCEGRTAREVRKQSPTWPSTPCTASSPPGPKARTELDRQGAKVVGRPKNLRG